MPLRKLAMKRRVYRGPETERKLAFMLAHQLHLQDTQQQRPFPESPLGRLPGEIRELIYEHVLVAPPSQSTKYLRVPLIAATNSDMTLANGAPITTNPKATSAESPQLALEKPPASAKVSYLAILQTCRQINREAYHIFYAKNSFHFTNAPDLLAFLFGIGQVRRAELTSLHIEGLVVDQSLWYTSFLDRYCIHRNICTAERGRLEALRWPGLHPDAYKASIALEGCKNLSKLILELPAEERFKYILFLIYDLGLSRPVAYVVDESHWVIKARRDGNIPPRQPLEDIKKWTNYRACHPNCVTGKKLRVEVEIIRDSEQELRKGFEVAIG